MNLFLHNQKSSPIVHNYPHTPHTYPHHLKHRCTGRFRGFGEGVRVKTGKTFFIYILNNKYKRQRDYVCNLTR